MSAPVSARRIWGPLRSIGSAQLTSISIGGWGGSLIPCESELTLHHQMTTSGEWDAPRRASEGQSRVLSSACECVRWPSCRHTRRMGGEESEREGEGGCSVSEDPGQESGYGRVSCRCSTVGWMPFADGCLRRCNLLLSPRRSHLTVRTWQSTSLMRGGSLTLSMRTGRHRL